MRAIIPMLERLAIDIAELKLATSRARLPREHQRNLKLLARSILDRPFKRANRQRRVFVVVREHWTDLMTRQGHIFVRQVVNSPSLRVECMIRGILAWVFHIPIFKPVQT